MVNDALEWQKARKRLTVDTKCSHCATPIRRRVWGDGESNIYCNRSCKRLREITLPTHAARVEADARRIRKAEYKKSIVYREIQALKRIATWVPGNTPTVRPCVVCQRKAKGKGNHSRHCNLCLSVKAKDSRDRAKQTESWRSTKRANRIAGKARLRAAKVETFDPMNVLHRDGWTCYICGTPTPKHKRGTYDTDAPEVDHVIPLPGGGR